MLDGGELVPAARAGFGEAKEIEAACLAAGVPAVLGKDDDCQSGCMPKLMVMVRPDDMARVRQLLQQRWLGMVARETDRYSALADLGLSSVESEDPPCPACGSVATLADGACPDCGLQLA